MIRRLAVVAAGFLLSACVQTGDAQFKPDYDEAARINTQLGMDYLAQGRVELAQIKFEKALSQNDDLPATYLGMALVHQAYKEHDRARSQFKKALNLAPRDSIIQTHYASFLCEQGDAEEARRYFDLALASTRNPVPERSLAESAKCFMAQGQPAEAETQLRRALEFNPRFGTALLQLATLSFERQDFLRARAFLQRFESVQEKTADSLLLGLRIEHQLGATAQAQDYALQLRNMVPGIANRIDLVTGEAW